MKKLYISLIILTCASNMLNAQAPGYLGKKLSLYYNASAFIHLERSNDYYDDESIGMNFRNDFSVDYTISRGTALGMSFRVSNPKITGTHIESYSYDDITGDYESKLYRGDIALHAKSIGVYAKIFFYGQKGFIAPLGAYQQFEICVGFTNPESLSTTFYPDDASLYTDFVKDLSEFNLSKPKPIFGFMYTFGTQNIYFDRMFFNASGQVGIFPGLSTDNDYYVYGDMGYADDFQSEYNKLVRNRFAGSYFLNINLGIGLLAL